MKYSVRILPAREVHGPAWAAKHPKRAGEPWLVANVEGKRERKRIGPDTPEAWERAEEERRERVLALEAVLGDLASGRSAMPTVNEAIDDFLAHGLRDHGSATREARGYQLTRFREAFGAKRLDDIHQLDVTRWWSEWVERGGRSFRTGMGHLEALSALYEHASERHDGIENPVPAARVKIKGPRRRTKGARSRDEVNKRPLRREELAALMAVVASESSDTELAVTLLVDTGMRIGELMELRWGDIDFADRRVRIQRNVTQKGVVEPPKGGKARAVVMSTRLARLLGEHRGKAGDRVLRLVERRTYRRALRRAAEMAEIGRDLVPKDLRDTFASQLLSAGMPLAWVSRQLGHESIATTAKHYAKWVGDEMRVPVAIAEGAVPTDLLELATDQMQAAVRTS